MAVPMALSQTHNSISVHQNYTKPKLTHLLPLIGNPSAQKHSFTQQTLMTVVWRLRVLGSAKMSFWL
jgi:hypothetical protein